MAKPTLKVTVKPLGGAAGDRIELAGVLADDTWSKLADLGSRTSATHVTIDLEGITGINSAGIRSWVLFIRPFAKDRLVCLECCPPCFVQQLNMILSMAAGCRVGSVLVPVECRACTTSRLVKVPEEDFADDAAITARLAGVCSRCGQPVQTSVELRDYFGFARSQDG